MNKKCPHCDSSEGVRKIIWGEPMGEPDPSKYVIGGCMVSEDPPDYRCLTCGLEFHRESRFIMSSSEGINILCQNCDTFVPAKDFQQNHECVKKPSPWDNY